MSASRPRAKLLLILTLLIGSVSGARTANLPAWHGHAAALSPLFERYVAVGTSISSGWTSDGITRESQADAWPVQLATLAGRTMSVPDLAPGSCRSPIATPIALNRRTDGSHAAEGASLPTCRTTGASARALVANLAIPGARTRDALVTTSESARVKHAAFYRLALPAGMAQIDAMTEQRPTFVSVELGANEVFGVYSGALIPGRTLLSESEWAHDYDELLARVRAVTNRALLVGLVDSLDRLPGFRRGDAIWQERAVLRLAFHVSVDSSCQSSRNLVFVPLVIPQTIALGVARRERGDPPAPLGCADRSGPDPDYVLTPDDEARVNARLARMNAFIRARADSLGFAYVDLSDIYTRADAHAELGVLSLMLSPWPFGRFVSADGVHPSAAGSRVLAVAAARAIESRYVGDADTIRRGVPR